MPIVRVFGAQRRKIAGLGSVLAAAGAFLLPALVLPTPAIDAALIVLILDHAA